MNEISFHKSNLQEIERRRILSAPDIKYSVSRKTARIWAMG